MAAQQPPVKPGTVSPDGHWFWNGAQWVATLPPAPAGSSATQSTSGYDGFAIGGAVAALIAVLVLYVASVVPYGTVDASGSSPSYSYSAFNVGGGAFPWYGFVNVIESTFALVAAVMILVTLRQRAARAVAAGAVLGSGVFAFFDWLGTLGSWVGTPGQHIALGSILGVVGGLVLLLGGLAATLGLLQRQTT